jgi:hypothetical protein
MQAAFALSSALNCALCHNFRSKKLRHCARTTKPLEERWLILSCPVRRVGRPTSSEITADAFSGVDINYTVDNPRNIRDGNANYILLSARGLKTYPGRAPERVAKAECSDQTFK